MRKFAGSTRVSNKMKFFPESGCPTLCGGQKVGEMEIREIK
jgi:hypothetical protein